jgi:hypothetical protein
VFGSEGKVAVMDCQTLACVLDRKVNNDLKAYISGIGNSKIKYRSFAGLRGKPYLTTKQLNIGLRDG